jgi:hypothetical protein
MENYHVPGIFSQHQIGGNPGRQMTPFGNAGPAFIGCRDGNEQPDLTGNRNNTEEITYG